MQTLPYELVNIIVNYIPKITDKRQFSKTCIPYNKITKKVIQLQESIIKYEHFDYPIEHCKEKFTLELCNDGYFDLIPDSYLTPDNNVIVKALTIYDQFELLNKTLENGCELFKYKTEYDEWYIDDDNIGINGNNLDNTCDHAVISGNLQLLIWARQSGCEWNDNTFELAAKYGHLHILKYLKDNNCDYNIYSYWHPVKNGDLHVLEWLYNEGYGMNESDGTNQLCQFAAEN
jgi:hypothetical protein